MRVPKFGLGLFIMKGSILMLSITMFMVVFGDDQFHMEATVQEMSNVITTVNEVYQLKPDRSLLLFGKDYLNMDRLLTTFAGLGFVQQSFDVNDVFPHYVYNSNTRLALFACPIGHTAPSLKAELLISYFTADVAAKSKEIKIALVTKFSQLQNMNNIVIALAKLIVDPNKYKSSLTLVVTESPGNSNRIIVNVQASLDRLIRDMRNRRAIYPTDAIILALEHIRNSNKQIILCELADCSDNVDMKIHNIGFTQVSPGDFSSKWNIAETSQQKIKVWVKTIQEHLCTLLTILPEIIRKNLEFQLNEEMADPDIIRNEVSILDEILQEWMAEEKPLTPTQLIHSILEIKKIAVASTDEFTVNKMLRKATACELLLFFDASLFKQDLPVYLRNTAIDILSKIIQPMLMWFHLFDELTLVANQNSEHASFLRSLGDNFRIDKPDDIKTITTSLDLPVSNTVIQQIANNPLQLKQVNKLLRAQILKKSSAYCPKVLNGKVLIIKNDFITSTEVNLLLKMHSTMHEQPDEVSNRYPEGLIDCDKTLSSIQVFAFKELIIDANLTVVGASLSLVSPHWRVRRTTTITMHGADGEPFLKPAEPNGLMKVDGQPGRPGQPPSAFIDIGEDFQNMETLTIRSEGGHGGNGQDGAPGGKAVDASEHIYIEEEKYHIHLRAFHTLQIDKYLGCSKLANYYKIIETENEFLFTYGHKYTDKQKANTYIPEDKITILNQKRDFKPIEETPAPSDESTNGGPGGDGGAAGTGAPAGIVQFYNLKGQTPAVNVILVEGIAGKCGNGGDGGSPGKMYSESLCTYTKKSVITKPECKQYPKSALCTTFRGNFGLIKREFKSFYTKGGLTQKGNPGKTCASSLHKQLPETPTIDLVNTLENFKIDALQELKTTETRSKLHMFLQSINSNLELSTKYGIKGIINAFRILEQRVSSLVRPTSNSWQLFELLQNRINALKNNTDTTTAFLKRAVNIKVLALKNSDHSGFMVNTRGYLEAILETNQEQAEANELIEINTRKEEFSSILINKITAAYSLLQSQISTKIDKI